MPESPASIPASLSMGMPPSNGSRVSGNSIVVVSSDVRVVSPTGAPVPLSGPALVAIGSEDGSTSEVVGDSVSSVPASLEPTVSVAPELSSDALLSPEPLLSLPVLGDEELLVDVSKLLESLGSVEPPLVSAPELAPVSTLVSPDGAVEPVSVSVAAVSVVSVSAVSSLDE